jgi:tRNA 2-thiouridine synthesizing protein D
MKWFVTISSNDPETAYNAMRLANVALIKKKQEVGVFMLGGAVDFQEFSTEQFNVAALTEKFMGAGGDFFV